MPIAYVPPFYSFKAWSEAQDAIHALSRAGFDVKKLSLAGKGWHTEGQAEQAVGFYVTDDRIKGWGATGAFWGRVWALLLAPAVFFVPGMGLLALAGPVTAALLGALEGAAVVGGLSALGAALIQTGISADHAIKYEAALKSDEYVLMVHGSAADTSRVDSILRSSHLARSPRDEPT